MNSESGDNRSECNQDMALIEGAKEGRRYLIIYFFVPAVIILLLLPFLVVSLITMPGIGYPLKSWNQIAPEYVNELLFKDVDSLDFLGVVATIGVAIAVATLDSSRIAVSQSEKILGELNADKKKNAANIIYQFKNISMLEIFLIYIIYALLLVFGYARLGESIAIGILAALLGAVLLISAVKVLVYSQRVIAVALPSTALGIRTRISKIKKATSARVYVYQISIVACVMGIEIISYFYLPNGDPSRWSLADYIRVSEVLLFLCLFVIHGSAKSAKQSFEIILGIVFCSVLSLLLVLSALFVLVKDRPDLEPSGWFWLLVAVFATLFVLSFVGNLGAVGIGFFRGIMGRRLKVLEYPRTVVPSGLGQKMLPRNKMFMVRYYGIISFVCLPFVMIFSPFIFRKVSETTSSLLSATVFVFIYLIFFTLIGLAVFAWIFSDNNKLAQQIRSIIVCIGVLTYVSLQGLESSAKTNLDWIWFPLVLSWISILLVVFVVWVNLSMPRWTITWWLITPRIWVTAQHNKSAFEEMRRLDLQIREIDRVYRNNK